MIILAKDITNINLAMIHAAKVATTCRLHVNDIYKRQSLSV